MQVFLVGFMGTGKTSLGKRLSSRLNIPFVDLDQTIEQNEQLSIAEIFNSKGEPYFRELEKKWISACDLQDAVVSLGGGAPCQEGIMDLLREKGIPVYIKTPVGVIVSRLLNSQGERPLIESVKNNEAELTEFVKTKLQEREKYYLRSKIIFQSTDVNADKLDLLADLILLSGS